MQIYEIILPFIADVSEGKMQIAEILPKLENPKKTNAGFVALCPAHFDDKQSLSVAESGGKILLKCFAGCQTEYIVSALGLEMKDLFAETLSSFQPKPQPKKRIVATYDYTDEQGNLLFQSIRYEPKGFTQRKPNGNGGFDYSLNGTRRVLYRLPEVLQAEMVFIVEGEKDVENIRKEGYTATCNPAGALKWRDEYNETLRNKTAVILPDNDEPGRKHALQVANSLYGIAKEILIIELPNLKPKGDVSDFFQDGGTIDEIIGLIERAGNWQPTDGKQAEAIKDEVEFENCFLVKSANEWLDEAKTRPIPKMLFGELWFESELCILFADTNLGKSILAVQIAESIASGLRVLPFENTTNKQKIVYFDFELSEKQFETRYAEKDLMSDFFTNHYQFSENFFRAEINPESDLPNHFRNFEEYLNFSIEQLLIETDAKVLLVDNLTYLRSETEKAKDALPLMKELKRLKKKHGLSILALAHTPKRDLSKPITRNDLQGSKMLINFCDSSFAIGESTKDKNLRYLKQIKARNVAINYDAENVCVFQIEKPSNFLRFDFLEYGKESEHLKQVSEKDKDILIEKAKELYGQGKTQQEIADNFGVSKMTISRYLKHL
jgi:hypothetical protein